MWRRAATETSLRAFGVGRSFLELLSTARTYALHVQGHALSKGIPEPSPAASPHRGDGRSERAPGRRGTKFAPIAKEVVVRDILEPLETIGIAITPEEWADLLT
jgi:hypothetical protein